MPVSLTLGKCVRHAWADTVKALRLEERKVLVISVALTCLTFGLVYFRAGRDAVMQQLPWTINGLIALGVVFLFLFGINLFRAPLVLLRASEADAELRAGESVALRAQIQAAEDRQPAIETALEVLGEEWLLVVRNIGANADFRAQFEITTRFGSWDGTALNVLNGVWKQDLGLTAEILSGHRASLRLALVNHQSDGGPTTNLYLYHGPVDGKARTNLMARWFLGTEPALPQPTMFFQVVLSSKPEMRGGPAVRAFVLTVNGVQELPAEFSTYR